LLGRWLTIQVLADSQGTRFELRIESLTPAGCAGEAVVFGTALIREQDPERVDAKRGTERRVEQREDAEHDGDDASPGLTLEQSPADEDATGSDDEERAADNRQDKGPDETANIFGGGDAGADNAAEDHEDEGRDHEERTGNGPEGA